MTQRNYKEKNVQEMTKIKVAQPLCDYCNFKSRDRATYVLREKGNHRFAGFLSLNNKARFDINQGTYEVEPRPNFCPNCGRDLRKDATQDKDK